MWSTVRLSDDGAICEGVVSKLIGNFPKLKKNNIKDFTKLAFDLRLIEVTCLASSAGRVWRSDAGLAVHIA